MPCPIALTAENTSITPSAQHRHRHALLQHVAAGPLEEGGDAQAAQLAARLALRRAAPRSRSSRPAPAPGPSRARSGRRRRSGPSGCVYGICSGRMKLRRRSCDAVDAGLARGLVHQPLDGEDRLGPAGAAVGAGRRGVGQHAPGSGSRPAGCRTRWSAPTGRSAAGWRRRCRWHRRPRWPCELQAQREDACRRRPAPARPACAGRGRGATARNSSLRSADPLDRPLQLPRAARRPPRLPDRRRSSCRSRRRRRPPSRAPARAAGRARRRRWCARRRASACSCGW